MVGETNPIEIPDLSFLEVGAGPDGNERGNLGVLGVRSCLEHDWPPTSAGGVDVIDDFKAGVTVQIVDASHIRQVIVGQVFCVAQVRGDRDQALSIDDQCVLFGRDGAFPNCLVDAVGHCLCFRFGGEVPRRQLWWLDRSSCGFLLCLIPGRACLFLRFLTITLKALPVQFCLDNRNLAGINDVWPVKRNRDSLVSLVLAIPGHFKERLALDLFLKRDQALQQGLRGRRTTRNVHVHGQVLVNA